MLKKTVSLRAGFREVYAERLIPHGFDLVKSRYPYFARVTYGGILQIVSFEKETPVFDPNKTQAGFSLCVGQTLLTHPLMDFNKVPITDGIQSCMLSFVRFFHDYVHETDQFLWDIVRYKYFYRKDSKEELQSALENSMREWIPSVMYVFDKVLTPEDFYLLGNQTPALAVLLGKTDVYLEKIRREHTALMRALENWKTSDTSVRETQQHQAEEDFRRLVQWLAERKPGGAEYEEYMRAASEMQEKNLRLLSELGVTPMPPPEPDDTASQNT